MDLEICQKAKLLRANSNSVASGCLCSNFLCSDHTLTSSAAKQISVQCMLHGCCCCNALFYYYFFLLPLHLTLIPKLLLLVLVLLSSPPPPPSLLLQHTTWACVCCHSFDRIVSPMCMSERMKLAARSFALSICLHVFWFSFFLFIKLFSLLLFCFFEK